MTTTPDPDAAPAPSRAGRVWAHTWRLLLAVGVGGSAGVVVYGLGLQGNPQFALLPSAPVWFFVDLALLAVCLPMYVVRHRAPLVLTGAIVVLGSFSLFSAGLVVFAVVSLATRRRWSEIVAVAALWCGATLVSERAFSAWVMPAETFPSAEVWAVAAQLVFTALVVVTGMFIGGRRALVASLREQAAIARREADARSDSARAGERNRIAREMHDVLAHRLSLVALHAGALEYRADLEPEQVQETAAVVRENAHEALGELREVLGLLRDPSAAEEHSRPQPTFAQVGDLVDGTRAAGSPVTFVLDHVAEDDLAQLPLSTSRHLYRVVQEALTNARKHAPGTPVQVRMHGSPGERVGVEVINPMPEHPPSAPLPTSGWGLTGLSERLRLTGGGLDVQRRDGTFVVQAWLPWAAGTEGQA
ncbi:sensor histidine kinase [Cellulomonas sp. S1-8]|uniref:sensor histidine kinase n=1 Tax=Cellulomonas sp. S1-8 TaxID=2904790 RepID=UPI0022441CA8|nr:histidine kinase [Cellulomonas sp. S1-8]UZN04229.1 histidine kinase [Cellulomonas sp. S1-8]